MMLIPTYAEKVFSILVSHGNLTANDSLYSHFKHDEFMYYAARDLTGYQYATIAGSIVTLTTHRRGNTSLVLVIEDSASDTDKDAIERANAEIQEYVLSEVAKIAEYIHENIKPAMDKQVAAA